MPAVPSASLPTPVSRLLAIAAALFLLSAAIAAPVHAQPASPTPPPAQPTPLPGETPVPVPPEYGGDPAPAPTPDPVAAPPESAPSFATPPEPAPAARPTVPPGFSRPVLAPTFAFSLSTRTAKHRSELDGMSIDVWLGARFHPVTAQASPFVALGAEINSRNGFYEPATNEVGSRQSGSGVTWAEVVPEMRFGWAYAASPATDYFNQVFPIIEVYGIAGWRLPNEHSGHAVRLGFGVSSPLVMVMGVAGQVPIPTQLELLMDVDSFTTGEREVVFRFGWHF